MALMKVRRFIPCERCAGWGVRSDRLTDCRECRGLGGFEECYEIAQPAVVRKFETAYTSFIWLEQFQAWWCAINQHLYEDGYCRHWFEVDMREQGVY